MAVNTKFSNNSIISLSLLVLGLGIAIISITTPRIGNISTDAARLSCQGPNSCYQIGSTITTASGSAVTVGSTCGSIGLGVAPNKICGEGFLCCGISIDRGKPQR